MSKAAMLVIRRDLQALTKPAVKALRDWGDVVHPKSDPRVT